MDSQASATIQLAISVAEIEQCFHVMSQLRSHLLADNFVQPKTGGFLILITLAGLPTAVA